MKRFTLRKIHQYAYSRQGWRMADKGFVYAIYDREWKKNAEACGVCTWGMWAKEQMEKYKYVDSARGKEVAQFWADWLNVNKADAFGVRLAIPSKIFAEGLELYKSGQPQVS